MLAELAKFFAKYGLMSKDEYIRTNGIPFTRREIEKAFGKYSMMLHELNMFNSQQPKQEVPAVAPTTAVVEPPVVEAPKATRTTKRTR